MHRRFELVQARATAAEFHARTVPVPARPEVWLHEVTRPALVLGSAQSTDVADVAACTRADVEMVRRRSGGGAVLLVPGEVAWIDVILPAGFDGWAADVHTPMIWLGRRLAESFAVHGVGPIDVHDDRLLSTPWSRLICFDGVGPGEVLCDGAKLVGMSQRRTRHSARLQCAWYSRHDHHDLVGLLAADGAPPVADLRPVATVAPAIAASVPATLLDLLNIGR